MKRCALMAVLWLAGGAAWAQSVSEYDTFSSVSLDSKRWERFNEAGATAPTSSNSGGVLTITGRGGRGVVASRARVGARAAVEADALGYTGQNQVLQLYGGTGAFQNFVEFGIEGTETDGTPLLNVWTPGDASYKARSPVPGPVSATNRTTLRIERDGNDFRFFANGILFHTRQSIALPGEARLALYGFHTSVSKWDNARLSGPHVLLDAPLSGALLKGGVDVRATVASNAVSWTLSVGAGTDPTAWQTVAAGEGAAGPALGRWEPDGFVDGPVTFRLHAVNAAGETRAHHVTATLNLPDILQPLPGQVVGPSFAVVAEGTATDYVSVRFLMDGALVGTDAVAPFSTRIVTAPGDDGEHTLTAVFIRRDGTSITSRPVHVTVRRDLFGGNPRVADRGRAFLFPNGVTTVAVAQNNAYTWTGLQPLYASGNLSETEAYVAKLRAMGVNVVRVMLEYAQYATDLLESPLGTYNPKVVAFWDAFFALCDRRGLTVLVTPWDTFFMHDNWAQSPYNAANGGPCATERDFITSPAARAAQKARFQFMIDRWGHHTSIFAIDVLNEFDIKWPGATEAERADWVNEMVAFVQDYEVQKWGRRHMTTVSSAAAEPTGIIGDTIYRHPRLDFATTHQYYPASMDPQNLIDPALEINRGVERSLGYIRDGRPYTDSESGPINNWPLDSGFDTRYYHNMTWAHFASGGAGTGMRWPYRRPHVLSDAMHQTQRGLAAVANDINWTTFNPQTIDNRLSASRADILPMGSADGRQALVWVLQDLRQHAVETIREATVTIAGLPAGRYNVRARNPTSGYSERFEERVVAAGATLTFELPPFQYDDAVIITPSYRGDLDRDNALTTADVALALSVAAGLAAPDPAMAASADVNGDGVADIVDVARLFRAVSGTEPL